MASIATARTNQQGVVMTNEQIARVCHEANYGYCMAIGDTTGAVPWAEAPDWQKTSAVNGVTALRADPEMTPEQLHESWLAEKVAAGWVYGAVKDPAAKTHPCCVAYGELPLEQRMKNRLYRMVVLALLEGLH